MRLKDWREVILEDFPDLGPITYGGVESIQHNARLYGGSFRELTGRIWTDAEYEARRARVLSRPLP
jgi:hypothetical protein